MRAAAVSRALALLGCTYPSVRTELQTDLEAAVALVIGGEQQNSGAYLGRHLFALEADGKLVHVNLAAGTRQPDVLAMHVGTEVILVRLQMAYDNDQQVLTPCYLVVIRRGDRSISCVPGRTSHVDFGYGYPSGTVVEGPVNVFHLATNDSAEPVLRLDLRDGITAIPLEIPGEVPASSVRRAQRIAVNQAGAVLAAMREESGGPGTHWAQLWLPNGDTHHFEGQWPCITAGPAADPEAFYGSGSRLQGTSMFAGTFRIPPGTTADSGIAKISTAFLLSSRCGIALEAPSRLVMYAESSLLEIETSPPGSTARELPVRSPTSNLLVWTEDGSRSYVIDDGATVHAFDENLVTRERWTRAQLSLGLLVRAAVRLGDGAAVIAAKQGAEGASSLHVLRKGATAFETLHADALEIWQIAPL